MKPGDLVQIASECGAYMSGEGVENTPLIPCGTLAIFLEWLELDRATYGIKESRAQIFIDGKVGWVLESAIEPARTK